MDGTAVFASDISFTRKMLMKLTTGINVLKSFLASLMQQAIMLECLSLQSFPAKSGDIIKCPNPCLGSCQYYSVLKRIARNERSSQCPELLWRKKVSQHWHQAPISKHNSSSNNNNNKSIRVGWPRVGTSSLQSWDQCYKTFMAVIYKFTNKIECLPLESNFCLV